MKVHEQMTTETITPAIAKKYLDTMITNRKLWDSRVIEIALQMEAGWTLNGETIKFSDQGALIDGQHRLHACILSGRSFDTYVARGISDPKAFATIDTGKSRTFGDVFSASGIKDANNVSAAAWLIYQYRHGLLTLSGPRAVRTQAFKAMTKNTRFSGAGSPRTISKEKLLEHAAGWIPDLEEGLRVARSCGGGKFLPISLLTACYVLFKDKGGEQQARDFLNDLGGGAGLRPDDPAHVLRDKLIGHMSGRARLSRHALLFLMFKAWNRRRAGQKSKALRIMDGEEFPKLV